MYSGSDFTVKENKKILIKHPKNFQKRVCMAIWFVGLLFLAYVLGN